MVSERTWLCPRGLWLAANRCMACSSFELCGCRVFLFAFWILLAPIEKKANTLKRCGFPFLLAMAAADGCVVPTGRCMCFVARHYPCCQDECTQIASENARFAWQGGGFSFGKVAVEPDARHHFLHTCLLSLYDCYEGQGCTLESLQRHPRVGMSGFPIVLWWISGIGA